MHARAGGEQLLQEAPGAGRPASHLQAVRCTSHSQVQTGARGAAGVATLARLQHVQGDQTRGRVQAGQGSDGGPGQLVQEVHASRSSKQA